MSDKILKETDFNGYELSRNWFDFCFENPDLIKPSHTALYFFCIEHCNRLGWKHKFGLPTEMAKEALGIKNYKSFSLALNDLIKWKFISIYQKSKNQYSANIIGLVNFTKANTKALSKASIKHSKKQDKKQVHRIVSINKQLTINNKLCVENEKKTHTPDLILNYEKFNNWLKKNAPQLLLFSEPISIDQYANLEEKIITKVYSKKMAYDVLKALSNKKNASQDWSSAYSTFEVWINYRLENGSDGLKKQTPAKPVAGPLSKPSIHKTINLDEQWHYVTLGIDKLYNIGSKFDDIGSVFYNRLDKAGVLLKSEHNLQEAHKYAQHQFTQRVDTSHWNNNEYEARKNSEMKKLTEEWFLKEVVKTVPKEELISILQPLLNKVAV